MREGLSTVIVGRPNVGKVFDAKITLFKIIKQL